MSISTSESSSLVRTVVGLGEGDDGDLTRRSARRITAAPCRCRSRRRARRWAGSGRGSGRPRSTPVRRAGPCAPGRRGCRRCGRAGRGRRRRGRCGRRRTGTSMSRFFALMLTMQYVVTVPRGPTSTCSDVATPQVGHAPLGGTYTLRQDGQRSPTVRRSDEGVDVGGLGAARRVGVVEAGGGDDAGDRVGELAGVALPVGPARPAGPSYGSKQAMSVMAPVRSAAQRTRTRMPVRTASGPGASRACSRAVSAPSSRTRTQAKGVSRGWPRRGSWFQAQVVTVPVAATSTRSRISSAVTGSYSTGGTRMRPSPVLHRGRRARAAR